MTATSATSLTDPDGLVNGDSIKYQQDWYAARGFVKNQVNVDTFVDNSYAEHVRATLAGWGTAPTSMDLRASSPNACPYG